MGDQTEPRVIYWFSGTGNSLHLARVLGTALGAELRPVSAGGPSDAAPTACLGVVFPVYCFGLPQAVADFLRHVPVSPGAYVFTVATMAMTPGGVHRQAARLLEGRGIPLSAGWSVRMPENFSPTSSQGSPEHNEKLLRQSEAKAAGIAADVAARRSHASEDSPLPMRAFGSLAYRFVSPRFATWDKGFRVSDVCTACGTCERVCPTANIRLDDDGRPVWLGHCQACYACMQWCPVDAITAGGTIPNRRRYHHPQVTAEDLFLRAGGDAEETTA